MSYLCLANVGCSFMEYAKAGPNAKNMLIWAIFKEIG